MARPQIFNQQQVIAKATECFWLKGFSETSLADLLQAMNISRSTFYNSFGDKRQLFELCLQSYGQQMQQVLAMLLSSPQHSGLQAIKEFLQLVLLVPTDILISKGCLLVNTIAETARVDGELNELAKQLMEPIKLAFINQLKKEFDEDASVRHGEWLFTLLLGWRLQTQMGIEKHILQQQIDLSITQIKRELDRQLDE